MLTRFDPFRDFDQLFDQLKTGQSVSRAMPIDIARNQDGYVVHADLPGVRPDSIELSVEGNVLTIRAERAGVRADDMQVLVTERPKGVYLRQLSVGDGFDLEKVDADYEDGVLSITLPVAERAKPRRIGIRAKKHGDVLETSPFKPEEVETG